MHYSSHAPLPLKDGCLFIDNSQLEKLQTCPREYEMLNLQKRTLAAVRVGANFGTAGHLVLEHRYRNYGIDVKADTKDHLEAEQAKLLEDFFLQNPPPEDDHRGLNWAIQLFVKKYNERYRLEPFNLLADANGLPMVEMPFAIPFAVYNLTTQKLRRFTSWEDVDRSCEVVICYSGKTDLPVMWDGMITIVDHKTTSRMGDQFWDELRVSPQQIGYAWAFWKCTGKMPVRFCVNGIRTNSLPAAPKGGVAKWWEESLQRNFEYISQWHFDEWEHNTFALIEEMLWHHSRSYFPMKRKWCTSYGKCQFYDVCYSPADQRAELLRSSAFEDYTWSPLKEKNETT